MKVTKTSPTFTSALKIFAELGHKDTVREIWQEAQHSLDLSEQLAPARIDAAAAEGDVETAALLLDEMNRSRVDINIPHVTSAIRACWTAEGNRWRAAEFLFQMSLDLRPQPTLATLACLAGASKTAPLKKVLGVYEMMDDKGLEPNKVFAEIYLISVVGLQKKESGKRYHTGELISYLRECSQDRLDSARSALESFNAAGVELSVLCRDLSLALEHLAREV